MLKRIKISKEPSLLLKFKRKKQKKMKSHQNLNQINVIFKFIIFNKEINSIVAIKKDKKLEIS